MNYMITVFIRYSMIWPLLFSPASSLTTLNYNRSCSHPELLWIYRPCHVLSLSVLNLGPWWCRCLQYPAVSLIHASLSGLHLYTSCQKNLLISRPAWIPWFSDSYLLYTTLVKSSSHFTRFESNFCASFQSVSSGKTMPSVYSLLYSSGLRSGYCFIDFTKNIFICVDYIYETKTILGWLCCLTSAPEFLRERCWENIHCNKGEEEKGRPEEDQVLSIKKRKK